MKIKTSALTDESPCPIHGKYHNVPMGEVPAGFLDWFRGQPHLIQKYPTVLAYVTKNSKVINAELDNPDKYGTPGFGFHDYEDQDY